MSSVRPNTEYSAEYSAKNGRIFGTEYSAKSADTPIGENREKMAIFDPISRNFWDLLLILIAKHFSALNLRAETSSFFIERV